MQEQNPQPIEWEKGKNDLEFFGQLDTPTLLEFLRENQDQALYYVREVLYIQECKKYRNGAGVRPETKILFTIGGLEIANLACVNDFAGNRVRTKSQEQYWKAPELHELVGLVSIYIEQADDFGLGLSEAEIFAEIADIFYNLFHLQLTDPEEAERWEFWIESLREAIGLDLFPIIEMLAAKYHTRMFMNDGKNNFNLEDELILEILTREFGNIEVDFKEMFTDVLDLGSVLNRREFNSRLRELKKQYRAEYLGDEEDEAEQISFWFASQVINWVIGTYIEPKANQKEKEENKKEINKIVRDILTGDIRK
jgi:hypothetical protein